MVSLLNEGDLTPSADAVAARAGVGRRTVFRLFSDMEGIFREIQLVMRELVEPVRHIPLKGETPEARLHALVDRRVLFFERILWVSAAALVHRHESAVLTADHAAMQAELRGLMLAQVPARASADPQLVEALDAVLSIDMWRRLRFDQKMGSEAAAAVLHRIVDALIGTACAPAGSGG